jgi:hypothetical protein
MTANNMTVRSNPHPDVTDGPMRPEDSFAESGSSAPGAHLETAPTLSRRDWFLLPFTAVATILLICITSEIVARCAFPKSHESSLDCLVLNDSSTGIRAIPNSVCVVKTEETRNVEYRFNRCGHRTDAECGLKPPNTYRIVVVGSSVVEGLLLPREQTIAPLLSAELSQRLGRNIEIYNTAVQLQSPRSIDLQMDRTLALKPDMILWPMTSWDFYNVELTTFARGNPQPLSLADLLATGSENFHKQEVSAALGVTIAQVIQFVMHNRTQFMLRYLLNHSDTVFDRAAILNPEASEILRIHTSETSLQQVEQFNRCAAEIVSKTRAAHIPLVVTMLPLRLQASMIALHQGPPEFDPYQPSRFARSSVESHGATFVDIFPYFERFPSTGRYYFPGDGHPNAQANALFAWALADALTAGAVPELAARNAKSESSAVNSNQ